MEFLSFDIAAGETKAFAIRARQIEIVDAQYPLTLSFVDQLGNTLEDGGLVNAPEGAFVDLQAVGECGGFFVTSANAQPVRLMIGRGTGGFRRLRGEVSVVDGAKVRSVAGNAWSNYAASVAGAGVVPAIQLANSAGSGRRLIVERMTIANGATAQTVVMSRSAFTSALVSAAVSKASAGTNALFTIRNGTAAAAPTGASIIRARPMAANEVEVLTFAGLAPVIVSPGQIICVYGSAAASDIALSIEFSDEAV